MTPRMMSTLFLPDPHSPRPSRDEAVSDDSGPALNIAQYLRSDTGETGDPRNDLRAAPRVLAGIVHVRVPREHGPGRI